MVFRVFVLRFCTLSSLLFSGLALSGTYHFYSSKAWEAFRWYVVGTVKGNEIRFIGNREPLRFPPDCHLKGEDLKISRQADLEKLEILRDQDVFLIEIDPLKKVERLYFSNNESRRCRKILPLEFSDPKKKGNVTPMLFTDAEKTRTLNGRFIIHTPISKQLDEKVSLAVLAGYGYLSLPNTLGVAAANISFFPMVQARGKWTPSFFNQNLSLHLELSENIFYFGAASFQSLRHSDIYAEGSYRFQFSPSFSSATYLGYGKHSSNDGGGEVKSVSTFLRSVQLPSLGVDAIWAPYPFALGFLFRAAIPNTWQYGKRQSVYETRLWADYNLTERLDLIFEFQYRIFNFALVSSETYIGGNLGLRLKL